MSTKGSAQVKTIPVKIRSIEKATHDVLRIVIAKPENYNFVPGQATEVSIDKPGWEEEKRPFTFTCRPETDYLEFTIKTYPERKGVTNELLSLKAGDTLLLHDVFGAINYKGVGMFIAGGAGVTPFIAILRNLWAKNEIDGNRLVFANKTEDDIINREEFETMLGGNFINILSDQEVEGIAHGKITKTFLKPHIVDIDQQFYVCGPPPMMNAVIEVLTKLNVPERCIVKEAL